MSQLKTLDQLVADDQEAERINNPRMYIENAWLSRAAAQGLKANSVAYRRAEIEFFCGAMAALNSQNPGDDTVVSPKIPPSWTFNPFCGRPIVGNK